MTKHYVQFYYPGLLFSETSQREIKSRKQSIKLPKGSYGYVIFDQEEVAVEGEKLVGKPKNHSARHLKGEIYDLARVKAEIPDSDILQSNMRSNKWDRVLKCGQGFISLDKDDVIIKSK
jgi:hypothetical protein